MGEKETIQEAVIKILPELQPVFEQLIAGGQKAFSDAPEGAFGGDFIAQPNSLQTGLSDILRNLQQRAELNNGNDFRSLGTATARGDFLDPNSNPALLNSLDLLRKNALTQFSEEILPTLRTRSQDPQQNLRQGLLEGTFAGQSQDNLANASKNLILQNYFNERGLQQNAGNILNQADARDLRPLQFQQQNSQLQQAFAQSALDNERAKFAEQQEGGFRPFNQFANTFVPLITGTTGQRVSTKSNTTPFEIIGGTIGGIASLGELAASAGGG